MKTGIAKEGVPFLKGLHQYANKCTQCLLATKKVQALREKDN